MFFVDDQSPFHRKVLKAGNEAWGAFCRAGAWSSAPANLTDGWIPAEVCEQIAGPKVWARLRAAGLTEAPIDGRDGEQIHDFLAYNRSGEKVRSERDAWRTRQQKSRESRISHGDVTRDKGGDSRPGHGAPDPDPVPDPKSLTHTPARAGGRDAVELQVTEAPGPGEPQVLAALRAEKAIAAAAATAPGGAALALLRLAENIEGRAISAGKPMPWIFEAVSQVGADLSAEGPGLQWAAAAKKIRSYTDNARAPRTEPANGARASPASRSTAQKCPGPGQRFEAGTEYTA